MSKIVHLIFNEVSLTVVGAIPELCDLLTYVHRSIDMETRGRPITSAPRAMFEMGEPYKGRPVLHTYQGLMGYVVACLQDNGCEIKYRDNRNVFPTPLLHKMFGFRFSQSTMLTQALVQQKSGLIGAPTRYGKCLGRGTLVMMATGFTKPVEDIKEGELVMGHDGTPRRVVGVVQGRDLMYRITPNSGGDIWTCTQDHILCLWRTPQGSPKKSPNKDGKEYLFSARQTAEGTKTFKHFHKLVRRGVDYPHKASEVDPYIYGLWLGDGSFNEPQITTADAAVARAFLRYAAANGMGWRVNKKPGNKARTYVLSKGIGYRWKGLNKTDGSRCCAFASFVRKSSKPEGKRIDPVYLFNSRAIRLELLAGLIDSDGYAVNKKVFEITTKWEGLRDDILRLARSVGFLASSRFVEKSCPTANGIFTGRYHSICISGNLEDVPVRLERKKIKDLKHRRNPLISGFSIEETGEDDYFGFELEGPDKLFLLGDFTVTHNSTLLLNTIRAFPGLKTVVTAPGIDLLQQLQEELTLALPYREVKGIYTGSHGKQQSDHGVTVVSMDSLEKCDFLGTKLVLIDEPHSIVTESRACLLHGFLNARRIGFGATLSGRFDKADIMIQALIGPVLANKTYIEARDEGAVCPLEVCVLNLPITAFAGVDRDAAYREAVVHNPQFKAAVADICLRALPADWQTLIFITTETQAKGLLEVIPHGTIAMGKLLNKAERKAMTARVKNNEIKRSICSNIYSTGTTFHEVRAMVNCGLGGGSISCVQKPGRLAEIRPGKKCGVVVDFAWKVKASGFPRMLDPEDALRMIPGNEAWKDVVRDSQSRLKVYREKGYNITYHDSVDSIRDYVAGCV